MSRDKSRKEKTPQNIEGVDLTESDDLTVVLNEDNQVEVLTKTSKASSKGKGKGKSRTNAKADEKTEAIEANAPLRKSKNTPVQVVSSIAMLLGIILGVIYVLYIK